MTIVDSQEEPVPVEKGMPGSVQAAVIGLLLLIAALLSVIGVVVSAGRPAITEPIGLLIAILVLYGVFRRYRLAWLWGRRIGLAGAILNAIVAVVHLVAATTGPGDSAEILQLDLTSRLLLAGFCAAAAIAQVMVYIALGFPSAVSFFDLDCPQCQATEVSANDFFFEQVKCGKCGNVWR